PKSGFCKWLLPPRHCGDTVANVESDATSVLGAAAPAVSFSAGVPEGAPFPFSAAAPEGAAVREARYTAIGSMSEVAMAAPRLPAIRRTVERQPARSFVRSRERAASWHLVQLPSKAAMPALTTAGSNLPGAAAPPVAPLPCSSLGLVGAVGSSAACASLGFAGA